MTFPMMDLPPKVEKPAIIRPADAELLPKTMTELVQFTQSKQNEQDLFWKELFKDQTPEEAARYKAHAEKMNAQRIKNFNDLIARYEENISSNNRRINETVPMLLNTWDSAVKEGKISKEQAEIEKLKVKSSLPEFHNANKRAQEMIVKYKAEIAKIK